MSDQEREELSDESTEEEEMSADSGAAEEAGDAEPEEQPPRYKPLSGY